MTEHPNHTPTETTPMHKSTPRRALVVVCGELTPYRVHWHRRIAREMAEFELHTLYFPHRAHKAWTYTDLRDIGLITFEPKRPADYETKAEVVRMSTRLSTFLKNPHLRTRYLVNRAEAKEAARVLAWLEEIRPAAVVLNGYAGHPFMDILPWGKKRGVPVLVWADSNVHGDKGTWARRMLKKIIVTRRLRHASAVLPCGTNGRALFQRYYPHPDRMFFVPLEPDYAKIESMTDEDARAVRETYGLDPARKRIIVVCRLIPLKRVDTVIDAFARLAAERPEWDLLIVGDGPERAGLEARVPADLKPRVIFPGFITDEKIVFAMYRGSDVMCLASEYEAWALVVNEAAASGLAMVVSKVVGAAPEFVREGVNGRTFTPGEVGEIEACLREVTKPENLDRMKAASKQVVAEWRAKADPIAGLRAALRTVGVLKS
jgi:glycosyltransferase involved in cell wall biosynthesis